MSDTPKENQAGQEKVGVYICHCGGNISDHVDVEEVRRRMEEQPGVAVARCNMFMCSDPGQELIMEDLKSGKVDRVVVASCAPSLHETTFRGAIARAGANPYIYEHANIREQVSWVHHGDKATDKAASLVAAAAAKASRLKPLEPIRVEAWQHATVVGGGVAGMRAALSLAERGMDVALVEKTPALGGQLANLDRIAPTGEKAADIIAELAGRVDDHPSVTVHTQAEITGFTGYIGNFRLKLALGGSGGPKELALETGVIILATGFKSYEPRQDEYGFGASPLVITLPQLMAEMKKGQAEGKHLEIDGRPIRSLAMIHCVGSRQIPGIHPEDEDGNLNQYCSRVCCTATLNAASRIREMHPGTKVYEFFRDIRTYGRGQEDIYEQASRSGVVFVRFEADAAPEVSLGPEGGQYPLSVKCQDVLTFNEEIEAPVDLVVLATGMEPNNVSDLVEMMKLPVGADRFLLEVHPKLRPVELPIAGILLAGTCQAPLDVGESTSAASAAAVKATAILAKGHVDLDPFVAEVDLAKCQGEGACVEACLKEDALNLVEMEVDGQTVQRAQVTQALCLGCGACVAACPHGAIAVNGSTLAQYEAMVDAIVAQRDAA